MICSKCKENGLLSIIMQGSSMETCAGVHSYYDETGKYHVHNSNWRTTDYTCSNGHKIQLNSKNRCPSCDFNAGQDYMEVK